MFLNKIAAKKITEPMEVWDEATESFVPGFIGRIDLTDRFLSNFNKPLRRRMLYTEFGTAFPASRTFRHPGTGQVYLLGQTRSDALDGQPYVDLTVCHLATDEPNGSAGLATIYRKSPAGPANDPGWLVEQPVAKAFVDLEFRTSANEADTYEVKVENFFAFLPAHIKCEEWDFLELHGKRYRVVDTFPDSGLAGLRVDEEPDHRLDFVLHVDGEKVYNRTTHQWDLTTASFNVTGVLTKYRDFALWAEDSESYFEVVIDKAHIGMRPVPSTMSLEIEGKRRIIRQVSTQPGERQYILRCQ